MSIADRPRYPLAVLPTPLHEAAGLRRALGGQARCPRILFKRDDLTGLALGGNKARKLEFLVGDALAHGATTLVTTGAAQSNHARMTAAAARAAGLGVALILTAREIPPPVEGNLLLDYVLGADVHFVPANPDPAFAIGDDEAKVAEVIDALRARGENPYLIAVGGSSAVGALGYVSGTFELMEQLRAAGEKPTRLYFASGSRGTQAGLTLGARVTAAPYALMSIAVSAGEPEKRARALGIANEAAELIGAPERIRETALVTDQGYIGDGYGIPTPGCLEAISLVARHEGVLLDPTYTGKAMAALVDHVRRGDLEPRETIVFLHTGGVPGLFAHAGAFARA